MKFYAALGNHDKTNERFYKPFNMDGKRFYSFKGQRGVLCRSTAITWIRSSSTGWASNSIVRVATWKICYFHHPLYSHGTFHGPDLDLRKLIEPLFQRTA